jgi:hypothetical protein
MKQLEMKQSRRNELGMSMVELIITMAISTIILMTASYIVIAGIELNKKLDYNAKRGSTWRYFAGLIQPAADRIRVQSLQYYRDASPTLFSQQTVVSDYELMTDTDKQTDSIAILNRFAAQAASGSFLSNFIQSALSNGDYPLFMDSHTLSRPVMNMNTNPAGTSSVDGTSVATVDLAIPSFDKYVVSRCFPVEQERLSARGESVDFDSPAASAWYVFASSDRRPFLSQDEDTGEYAVSCCPKSNPNCTDGSDISNWIFRAYFIYKNPDTGRIESVDEIPTANKTDVVWGAGFIMSVDNPDTPSKYSVNMFIIENKCLLSTLSNKEDCEHLTPGMRIEGDEVEIMTYFDRHVKPSVSTWTGILSTPLSNSGIISL